MPAGAADDPCYLRFRVTVKDRAGKVERGRRARPGRCGCRRRFGDPGRGWEAWRVRGESTLAHPWSHVFRARAHAAAAAVAGGHGILTGTTSRALVPKGAG